MFLVEITVNYTTQVKPPIIIIHIASHPNDHVIMLMCDNQYFLEGPVASCHVLIPGLL